MITNNKKKPLNEKHFNKNDFFHVFSRGVSRIVGHGSTFCLALAFILVWLVTGPIFKFSDSWQLIINTLTTIITFLMVFIIQNTQNRDNQSTQLKLDELIRVHKLAHNSIIDLDKLTNDEIDELENKYKALSSRRPRG